MGTRYAGGEKKALSSVGGCPGCSGCVSVQVVLTI